MTAGPDYQEAAADYINQHADFVYTTQYFQTLIIRRVFLFFFFAGVRKYSMCQSWNAEQSQWILSL